MKSVMERMGEVFCFFVFFFFKKKKWSHDILNPEIN